MAGTVKAKGNSRNLDVDVNFEGESWSSADDFGKAVQYVVRITQLALFILLIVDLSFRLCGTKIGGRYGFMHCYRFIVMMFIFNSFDFISGNLTYFWRGMDTAVMSGYTKEYYEKGYFGSGYYHVVNGIPSDSEANASRNFINSCFVELIIYFTLLIVSVLLLPMLKKGSRISSFFSSLRFLFILCFGLYMIVLAVLHWNHNDLKSTVNKNGANTIGLLLGLLIIIIFLIEMVLMYIRGPVLALSTYSAKYRNRATRKETTMLVDVYNDVNASHMNDYGRRALATNYNFYWIIRWAIFAFFNGVLYKNNRTMSLIDVCFQVFVFAVTIFLFSTHSFRICSGILIVIEEFLLLFWFICGCCIVWDEKRVNHFGSGGISFMCVTMFICFLLVIVIEYILLIVGFLYGFMGHDETSGMSQVEKPDFDFDDKAIDNKIKYMADTGNPKQSQI